MESIRMLRTSLVLVLLASLSQLTAARASRLLKAFRVREKNHVLLSAEDVKFVRQSPFGEFSQITNGLYHSSIAGINGTNLINNQIGCIFDIAKEYDPPYELPGDSGIEKLSINQSIEKYNYHMINDDTDANVAPYLDEIVGNMESCAQRGKKIAIHCVAGSSRSGSLVAAFLMKHEGMTLEQAYIHAKTKRPIFQPNPAFLKQLCESEAKIHGNCSAKFTPVTRGKIMIMEPEFIVNNKSLSGALDYDFHKAEPLLASKVIHEIATCN